MTIERREVVRNAFAAIRDAALADGTERDPRWLDWWDPKVVYREDPKWPGTAVHHGVEAVTAAFRGYLEVLVVTSFEIEGVTEIGDAVVARVRIAGTSRDTHVPYDHRWAYVARVRDGRVVQFQAFYDPDEAITAAESAAARTS